MHSAHSPLPKSQTVAAALRKTTEGLAQSLACSFAQADDQAPDWTDFEWRIAQATAAIHGVAPLLSGTLRWQGPAEWLDFLAQQKDHTRARHRRVEELLGRLDHCAQIAGIAAVALKGAALHALGLYAPGERPMADVDVLVAESDCVSACRMIEELGFEATLVTWKHRVFEASGRESPGVLGEHRGNHLKIELHTFIGEALPVRVTRLTGLIYPHKPHPGLNPYPSNAALMLHLTLHAAGSMVFRALRLLHLHDLARVATRMNDADWDELLQHIRVLDGPAWALLPLKLTARYFTSAIPTRVLEALSPARPWLLERVARRRSLSDFSLSYLWVDAFPGIEWSTSAAEMLKYIANRVRPDAQTLKLRKQILDSSPSGKASQWQQLSQRQRIVRWLVSRPARDETLFAVRAALATAP